MKTFYRVFFVLGIVLCLAGFQADSVLSQVPNSVNVDAIGTPSNIEVHIALDIGGVLPEEWVGWVVDRRTLGNCDDPFVQLGAMELFPAGVQNYVLMDNSAVPGTTYKYRIYAVDDGGTRYILPTYTLFPPGYYHFDYAAINGVGIVAEGVITDAGFGSVGITVCPDNCWEPISFISSPPPEFVDWAGNGVTVQIVGTLAAEFEGPYIWEVFSYSFIFGCGPVPVEDTNWGNIKAMYR